MVGLSGESEWWNVCEWLVEAWVAGASVGVSGGCERCERWGRGWGLSGGWTSGDKSGRLVLHQCRETSMHAAYVEQLDRACLMDVLQERRFPPQFN